MYVLLRFSSCNIDRQWDFVAFLFFMMALSPVLIVVMGYMVMLQACGCVLQVNIIVLYSYIYLAVGWLHSLELRDFVAHYFMS